MSQIIKEGERRTDPGRLSSGTSRPLREPLGDVAVGVEGPPGSGGGVGWNLVFFLFLFRTLFGTKTTFEKLVA